MPDIDTRLLRSFVSAVGEGSFSSAAETLGCTRRTMSLRVRALETRLGVRLLDRSGRGLRLTPAGRDVYADASEIVEMHDRLFKPGRELRPDEGNRRSPDPAARDGDLRAGGSRITDDEFR